MLLVSILFILGLGAGAAMADTYTIRHKITLNNNTNIAGIPPPFAQLPPMLSNLSLYQSQWIPIIVEGGNVTDDGQVKLIFNATRIPGVRAVATREWQPGEAVCATVNFPSATYSGVSMDFFGLSVSPGRNMTISVNDHTDDEMDFEFLGTPLNFQTHFYQKGGSGDVQRYTYGPGNTTYDLCMYFNASAVTPAPPGSQNIATWFVNGVPIQNSTATFGPMYAHFGIWNTANVWGGCCGAINTSNIFEMDVTAFSIYSPDPNVTFIPPSATSTSKSVPVKTVGPNNKNSTTGTKGGGSAKGKSSAVADGRAAMRFAAGFGLFTVAIFLVLV